MFPFLGANDGDYGAAFKKECTGFRGHAATGGYGKVIGRTDNRVTVHPDRRNAFAIPIPVVHFRFGDIDQKIYAQMRTAASNGGSSQSRYSQHAARSAGRFRRARKMQSRTLLDLGK
jgi:hypothetical protein